MEVLTKCKALFAPLPTVQEIPLLESEKLTIVGDLHGQLKVCMPATTVIDDIG
jgi:hypothetical protein